MSALVAGQNAPVPSGPAAFAARGAVAAGNLYGLAVLPEGGSGWLSLQDGPCPWATPRGDGAVEVRPDSLPSGVRRVHVGVYARRGGTTMRGFLPATFDLAGHGFAVGADELGATFLAFAELYLRDGTWKVRARADWSVAGVADFARRHGCAVSDDPSPEIGGPAPSDVRPDHGDGPPRGAADWTGSAFVVGKGVVATNAHVASEARRILAVGDEGRFEAETLVADEAADIALVRLRGCRDLAPLAFRPGFDLSGGEPVFAVGFPLGGFLGAGPQITPGMVANPIGPNNDTRLVQISAPIQPGSSGGPVLDASGRLVAVAVASLTGAQNVNFAVRAALVSYLAQSVGIDVAPAGAEQPLAPDRILRSVRGSLFKLECSR